MKLWAFASVRQGEGGLGFPGVLRNKTCYWTPVMEIENEGSALYFFLVTSDSSLAPNRVPSNSQDYSFDFRWCLSDLSH